MKLPFMLPLVVATSIFSMFSCSKSAGQKNADGSVTINTTEMGKDVQGFAGATPLNVTIDANGAIVKVEALENKETPEYFSMVQEKLIPQFEGKTSIDGVDAVSGATFSSRAVLKNVQLALDEYKKDN